MWVKLIRALLAVAALAVLGLLALSFNPWGGAERSEPASGEPSRPLFASPERVASERATFEEALKSHTGPLRDLYEHWVDRIGANGILDGIEGLRPLCHSEAHDLGKVVYARVGEVGAALRACDRRCHSGCMHGVLMEAFTAACSVDGQLRFELLAPSVELMCKADTMRAHYSDGDCAHGVGHALMFLSEYEVGRALEACGGFQQEIMRYYCATGAYMEFVTDGRADAALAEVRFAPCSEHPYPAACARYLMPRLLHFEMQGRGSPQRAVDLCLGQEGAVRLGCFHGLGNAFMPYVSSGGTSLADACLRFERDEARMCVEGTMERMGRYEPQRARDVCRELEGASRRICDTARLNRMYAMDKDLRLYSTGGDL